jgi:threonine dehydratase
MNLATNLVTLSDVEAAAARIEGLAVRTPLLAFGDNLWLKPENLQPIGAFKIRGAANAVSSMSPSAVVTHSSGNHGRALAFAASRLGIPVTVVMPSTSPKVKIDAIRVLGATIEIVEPADRLTAALRVASETGATLIPPFDHPAVIAGQGTIGLEIVVEKPSVEVVYVPIGGGGLISGVGAAVKALSPSTRVIGVEPLLAAETAESLRAGRLITWPTERTYQTVADGVRTAPSELTFAHIQKFVDDIVTVTEEEILAAMRTLALEARLVAEPSGALSVAAALREGGRGVAIISGGNVDPSLLQSCLA